MKKNYLNAQTSVVEMEIDNAIMGTSLFDSNQEITEGDGGFA